jgi:uncharacterized protein (DUF2461 family)
VADDVAGTLLQALADDLRRRGIELAGHDRLKTAPRGYPRDHPRVELLRYKGIIAWRQWPVAAWLGTAAAKRRVVEFLRAATPLNEWLASHVGPSEAV